MSEPKNTSSQLDPRAPFVFDVHELTRRPGAMLVKHPTLPAPDGIQLELIGIPSGTPIDLDLRFESVVEGVLVSGSAHTTASGECGRCLIPVTYDVSADLQDLFAYPDSATAHTTTEEEVSRLEGDLLDLEPAVRDAIVLEIPVTPLCRDDCLGLCVGCGARWADLPADHSHEQVDPRWAALTERLSDEHDNEEK